MYNCNKSTDWRRYTDSINAWTYDWLLPGNIVHTYGGYVHVWNINVELY